MQCFKILAIYLTSKFLFLSRFFLVFIILVSEQQDPR